ncbi:protein FAM [Ditylenchus destructor]|uniref:Protein FAM n=1 Tax=Ditylenchus destructor TaxID=166010 RepID=A0AAD4R2I8_9BILA|nr:protein FAM [Ditylenchus destructor]
MSFLRVKKRRIQFNVELTVISLSDVPLLNAVIFAKVRLMDCGSFEGYTWHRPVRNYQVDFMKPLQPQPDEPPLEMPDVSESENPQPFRFQCRIPFDDRNGELEECKCKISLRKEDRSGRSPQKLGFVVLNLSEFAASGTTGITDSFLLDGYSGGQRQDNSRVQCHVTMMHQAQDPLFKVPTATVSAVEEANLNPVDRKAPSSTECSTAPTDWIADRRGLAKCPLQPTGTIHWRRLFIRDLPATTTTINHKVDRRRVWPPHRPPHLSFPGPPTGRRGMQDIQFKSSISKA